MSFRDDIISNARQYRAEKAAEEKREAERRENAGSDLAQVTIRAISRDLKKTARTRGTVVQDGKETVSCVLVLPEGYGLQLDDQAICHRCFAKMLKYEEREWEEVVREKDPFPEMHWPGREKIVRRGIRQRHKDVTLSIDQDSPIFRDYDSELRRLAREEDIRISYCAIDKRSSCPWPELTELDTIGELPYTADAYLRDAASFLRLGVRASYTFEPEGEDR